MTEVDPWSDVEVPDPFVRFFRSEYPAVVSLVFGLGYQAAVEDVAQEAFLELTEIGLDSRRWNLQRARSGV